MFHLGWIGKIPESMPEYTKLPGPSELRGEHYQGRREVLLFCEHLMSDMLGIPRWNGHVTKLLGTCAYARVLLRTCYIELLYKSTSIHVCLCVRTRSQGRLVNPSPILTPIRLYTCTYTYTDSTLGPETMQCPRPKYCKLILF